MDGAVQKVHHSYIWLGGLKAYLATLIGIIVGVASSVPSIAAWLAQSGYGFGPLAIVLGAVLILVLLVGIFALGFWLSWKHLSYEVGISEFSLYKGVFSKKRLHVPYQRVQSVDIRASLLQRIAGVCSVEIDTAGGASNSAIVVPYVTKAAAKELRHELFARKQAILNSEDVARAAAAVQSSQVSVGAASSNVLDELSEAFSDARGVFDSGSFAQTRAPSFEVRLTNKELALCGLADVKSAGGAIVLGILGVFAFIVGFDSASDAFAAWIEGLIGASVLAGQDAGAVVVAAATRLVPLLVLGIVCGALVIVALSLLSSVLSYGNFCARRRGNRIEVERGLLQHQTQGVDVDRVQFVRVEHGWIRRMLGYCKVYLGRIDSVAGNDGAGNSSMSKESAAGMVVHPFLKTDDLPTLLEGLVPELDFFFEEEVVCVPPPRAKRRAAVRCAFWRSAGFWILLGAVVCVACVLICLSLTGSSYLAAAQRLAMMSWPLLVIFLGDMVVGVVRGLKWHAGSCLAYSKDLVRVVNEGFTRDEVVVPRKKIQFACLRANPFQTMAKVRCVLVTTAAGTNATRECIYDIDEEEASAFLGWTRPRR